MQIKIFPYQTISISNIHIHVLPIQLTGGQSHTRFISRHNGSIWCKQQCDMHSFRWWLYLDECPEASAGNQATAICARVLSGRGSHPRDDPTKKTKPTARVYVRRNVQNPRQAKRTKMRQNRGAPSLACIKKAQAERIQNIASQERQKGAKL